MDATAASNAEPESLLPDPEPRARTGTGRWVESSWDLHRGLTVHEGLPPDAGLDEWLEAMLRE